MFTVAYLAMFLYIVIGLTVIHGSTAQNFTFRVTVVYLTGILFLPNRTAFDLPLVPPMDKQVVSGLVAFVGARMHPLGRGDIKPFSGVSLLLWLGALGYIGTTLANKDVLNFGPKRMPSLTYSDSIAGFVLTFTRVGSAFFAARAAVRKPEDVEQLLKGLVVMGLTYVPVCLFELRMSPQLHKMVYGFTVIGFDNIRRGEGYKPVGFLSGGLAMAIFLYTAAGACAVLARVGARVAGQKAVVYFWLIWLVLAVSKNLGANIFATLTIACLFFFGWRMPYRVAAVLVLLVFAYPYVRGNGIVNVYPMIDWISQYSTDRAASLNTRFVNEDEMFQRFALRPWFGWGGYGRNKIYDFKGISNTIQDGGWIIILGMRGVVGFIAYFGLMGLPVFGWVKRVRNVPDRQKRVIGGLLLLLGFRMADLLPNGIFTPIPVFLAGALAGLKDGWRSWAPPPQA